MKINKYVLKEAPGGNWYAVPSDKLDTYEDWISEGELLSRQPDSVRYIGGSPLTLEFFDPRHVREAIQETVDNLTDAQSATAAHVEAERLVELFEGVDEPPPVREE